MPFCKSIMCWQTIPCQVHDCRLSTQSDSLQDTKQTSSPAETLEKVLQGNDTQQVFEITYVKTKFLRGMLRAEVWRVAGLLTKVGIKKGDVVALSFANTYELIVSFLALTFLGMATLPLNPKSQVSECEFCFADVQSKWLLVGEFGNGAAETACAHVGGAVLTVVADNETGICSVLPKARCPPMNESAPLTSALPDDVALILYTSGTTGKPKGVPLTHGNITTTLRNITRTYHLSPSDKGYVVMPLFHVHGLMAGFLSPLYAGGGIVLPANGAGFQAGVFWQHVAQYGVTWYTAVPTMHQALLEHASDFETAGCPSLRFIRSCSSSLPPPVLHQLESTFSAPVLEAYAMTEACHQMTSNPLPSEGTHKAGSVGRGVNVEVKILGENMQWVEKSGVSGEVCVKGKNVCKGYLNRPEANAKLFTQDGYLRTDDQGYLDEDSYLFLTSRLKENINRGGEKIAPVHIDNVLLGCPGVLQLFAFAAKHEKLGEVVAVAVALQPGKEVSLRQLNRFGLDSGKLRMEELPECIVYCDSVPTGPTGKVQRVKLPEVFCLPVLSETPISFRCTRDGLERLLTEAKTENKTGMAYLAEIVGAALGVELHDSTATLVLDSFTAVRLSKELGHKLKARILPKELVAGVTLEQLYHAVTLVEGKMEEQDESAQRWEKEATLPSSLLKALAKYTKKASQKPVDCRDVLLTGATGFLGAHLVVALLCAGANRVLCPVRGNIIEVSTRLEEQLRAQQLWVEEYRSRIVALQGDVTLPGYNLNINYLSKCCAIIHNAANVNHALPFEDLRKDNVESTLHGIELCAKITKDRKQMCHFVLISSAAVCGRRSFTMEAQPRRLENIASSNGYVQSKWVAERIVENAALACPAAGPPHFAIFRPGALTGHRETGHCNLGDSVNRYMIGFLLMNSAPPLPASVQVDMSPVDWVASAIAGITLQDAGVIPSPAPIFPPSFENRCPIYTLDNGRSLLCSDLINLLEIPVASDYHSWVKQLEALKDADAKSSHKSLIRNPLLGLYGALRVAPPLFGCTGSQHHMSLLEQRGFESPPITARVLAVYIRRFVELGALPSSALDIAALFPRQ